MILASWSTRRILTIWVAGLTLQALLVLAPALLARHVVANRAAMLHVIAEENARWRSTELADSLSLAKQREDARKARSYSLTRSGETLFALVHIPSGRPDSAAVAASSQRLRRTARYTTAIILGLIPTLLLLLTLIWMIARRNDAGPTSSLSAA